jgi:hypothetical protein
MVLGTLVILAGCTTDNPKNSATPYLDQHWGKAFEHAKQAQTLNPEPAHGAKPVEDMDGRRAANLEDRYNETFGAQTQRPVYNIDMPGVTSSR